MEFVFLIAYNRYITIEIRLEAEMLERSLYITIEIRLEAEMLERSLIVPAVTLNRSPLFGNANPARMATCVV